MRTPCFAFGLLALVVCTSAAITDSAGADSADADSADANAVQYKQVTMEVNMIGYTATTINDKTTALRASLAIVSVIPSSLTQLSFGSYI
jgi:hypothetical protein